MSFLKGLTLKMAYGYLTIAIISIGVFLVTMVILRSNQNMDRRISETLVPTLIVFKDGNTLAMEIKRLNNSWIYTPTAADKARLNKIINEEIGDFLQRITHLAEQNKEEEFYPNLQNLQSSLQTVLTASQELTGKLASDEDYGDDTKVDGALTIYEKKILPEIDSTERAVATTISQLNGAMKTMQADKQSSFTNLIVSFITMLVFIIGAGIISLVVSHRIIIEPINRLKDVISAVARGEILTLTESRSRDEIAEMHNNITGMLKGFKENTDFAIQIGKGNYTKDFKPLSEKDELGNALLDMRSNLQHNAEDEQKRNWVTTGMAQIGEILRKNTLTMTELTNEIIRYVVTYSKSNQGGLFIVEKNATG